MLPKDWYDRLQLSQKQFFRKIDVYRAPVLSDEKRDNSVTFNFSIFQYGK